MRRHTSHTRGGAKPAWQEGAETGPSDNAKLEGVTQTAKAGSTFSGELAGGTGETSDEALEDEVPVKGPVPRVRMEHFYVSSCKVRHAMWSWASPITDREES